MNLKELRELIELVSEKGFAEFEIERQGFRLRICTSKEAPAQIMQPTTTPVIVPSPINIPYEIPAPATSSRELSAADPAATAPQPSVEPEKGEPAAQFHTIKSPIVGTFFRSPSPTTEPFVSIGDHVEPDSVVCIIEAMKLMNEIQAEVAGEVVKMYVENGQPVEYGQPLFEIRL
jgi:acetyl-CoA carboxylase biotin carboxyl carrier protein